MPGGGGAARRARRAASRRGPGSQNRTGKVMLTWKWKVEAGDRGGATQARLDLYPGQRSRPGTADCRSNGHAGRRSREAAGQLPFTAKTVSVTALAAPITDFQRQHRRNVETGCRGGTEGGEVTAEECC